MTRIGTSSMRWGKHRARDVGDTRPSFRIQVEPRFDQPQVPPHAVGTQHALAPLDVRHLLPAQRYLRMAPGRLRAAGRAEDAITKVARALEHCLLTAFRDLHAGHLHAQRRFRPLVGVLLAAATGVVEPAAGLRRVDFGEVLCVIRQHHHVVLL